MSIPENYVGKPQPGTPFASRAQELDTMRFIDIRNMAYMHYKVPDPQNAGAERAILTYMESLSMPRDQVKRLVLQFEVQNGVIVPDGTEAQYFNAQPAAPTEGAPQMSAQPQYPPQPPSPQQMSIPGSQPPAPGFPSAPPPPQGYPQQPAVAGPPPAPPTFQAPPPPGGVPGVPPQQFAAPPNGAPEAPAPRGRKRATASSNSAVAPPPPAPPPAPSPGFQGPAQAAPPQPGFPAAPPQAYAGPPGPPPPPQGWVPPPPPPHPQAAAAPVGIAPDMSAIVKTLDGLGGGLASTSKDVETLKAELAELKTLNICILMALQHLWTQNPNIANWAKGAGFDTGNNVLAFKAWLASTLPR